MSGLNTGLSSKESCLVRDNLDLSFLDFFCFQKIRKKSSGQSCDLASVQLSFWLYIYTHRWNMKVQYTPSNSWWKSVHFWASFERLFTCDHSVFFQLRNAHWDYGENCINEWRNLPHAVVSIQCKRGHWMTHQSGKKHYVHYKMMEHVFDLAHK